jgi:hypothetical protein
MSGRTLRAAGTREVSRLPAGTPHAPRHIGRISVKQAYRRGVRKHASRRPEQVFSVTSLPPSLEEDQAQRMRRYLVSMGIRTACFILAVVALAVLHWTVIGWALVIGAAVLPYIAVVMANATRSPQSTALGPVTPNDDTTPQISPRRPDEEPPR